MLKHMPKKALKILEKHLLYRKKIRIYGNEIDILAHNY